jgi:catechol 2,3-dioxygenase-like lactoylglutathione lyase family enzyme
MSASGMRDARIASVSQPAMRALVIPLIVGLGTLLPSAHADPRKDNDMTATRLRYMVNDIDASVSFYTKQLGFQVKQGPNPNFAILSRGGFELVLSTPFGPGGAAKPMANGEKAKPGGWNRIIINVTDLPAEVDKLRKAKVHFRSDILKGPGGSEIVFDDPSGNPVELFQPSAPAEHDKM